MKKVPGIVRYKGIACLTVAENVAAGKTRVNGGLRGIKKAVKPFNRLNYV
ncbi:hypothetical protein [Planococcus lenghuensis]|nr:hypothetical protein [Planococcus lenghuensis]